MTISETRDFTTLEPKMVVLYESVLDNVDAGSGTRLLDLGCGAGLFLRLAAQRGATVTGIDLTVGEIESLPYGDDAFDVVTAINAFQFAAEPAKALREAGRVGRRGAPVVIATWGRPEQCEASGYVRAVESLLPPPPPGAPGPFGLSEEGAIEASAAGGGLAPGERHEVLCVWSYPDQDSLLRALGSTAFAVEAAQSAGEEKVSEAILEAVAPYRTIDGGYRLENVFTYMVARIQRGG